jgi:hypothetical protein
MKLLITQFSPLSHHLIPLWSKYPPQHVRWVPVTTTWHVLRLRMEKEPPAMEGTCEYIE